MTSQKFDIYKFHDNSIHGILFLIENFTAELQLDIDHILQWPRCSDNEAVFDVSKALVRFCDVSDLSINFEWSKKGPETAISRIYIDKIIREEISTTLRLPAYYKWRIEMSDEQSVISFGASAMIVELAKSSIVVNRPYLMAGERNQ